MLGEFHTAKCVEHCIGKYIGGGGIDDILNQTKVFGTKITESIVNGTDYGRSLKAILILSHAFAKLKWQAFFEHHDVTTLSDFLYDVRNLRTCLNSKDAVRSQEIYNICRSKSEKLQNEFEQFSIKCSANPELCSLGMDLLNLLLFLKTLIAADREGNWEAMQNLLPIFFSII